MLERGERVLVGVSGGADSVCLLLALKELGYAPVAAHLNHGWRGDESDGDEAFVRELCTAEGVSLVCRRNGESPGSRNYEEAGRLARKAFFQDVCKKHLLRRIALAHNQEDRVETFLLNLLRGSGTRGLTSMEPVSGQVIRPLIETTRPEIETWLTQK